MLARRVDYNERNFQQNVICYCQRSNLTSVTNVPLDFCISQKNYCFRVLEIIKMRTQTPEVSLSRVVIKIDSSIGRVIIRTESRRLSFSIKNRNSSIAVRNSYCIIFVFCLEELQFVEQKLICCFESSQLKIGKKQALRSNTVSH